MPWNSRNSVGVSGSELRVDVAGLHLQLVEKLDPGDRDAALDGEDHRVAGRLDARERADAAGDRLRDAVQPERQLGDDAERALRADQQPGQVVAGGGFLRPVRRS